MVGTLLIGLREGLEAALVVSVLLTYVTKLGRRDAAVKIWIGVGFAVAVSLIAGAVLTYGAYMLTFTAQEVIGGSLSIIAVAMITWMVFWMLKASKGLSAQLRDKMDHALIGNGWGVALLAAVTVGREGLETALFIWTATQASNTSPLLGFLTAVSGIIIAVLLGWALKRGLLRVNLTRFFRWSGVLLIVFAAGVLAYGIHDLQEAGVLPGPFMAAPAGAGAFVAGWFAEQAWAFQIGHVIAPDGVLGTLLKGTIGFSPEMTKLEVLAWALYIVPALFFFLRTSYRLEAEQRAAKRASAPDPDPEPQPGTRIRTVQKGTS